MCTAARIELAMPSSQSRFSAIEAADWRSAGATSRAWAPSTTVTDWPATSAALRDRLVQHRCAAEAHELLGLPKRVDGPAARMAACSPGESVIVHGR